MVPVRYIPTLKFERFSSAEGLCKWVNENNLDQAQIVAITECLSYYTLFYYE